MDLYIIKKFECAKLFYKKKNKNDIFLTFDNISFEYLKSKNCKVLLPSEIINENFFLNKYGYDKKIFIIIKELNKILFKTDDFYKIRNWKIFDHYIIYLKHLLDSAYYSNKVINLILKKYKIKKIFLNKYYDPNNDYDYNYNFKNLDFFLFNDKKINKKIKFVKTIIVNNKNLFQINNYRTLLKNKIKELLFSVFKNKGNGILFVNFSKSLSLKKYFSPIFLDLIYKVNKKKNINIYKKLNKQFFIDNINISNLINQFYDSKQNEINCIKKKYYFYKNQKIKFNYIIFKYSINSILGIIFIQIAKELKIKTLIWSHGAYGFDKSFSGYKYTDHLFFKNIGHVGETIKLKKKKIFNLGYLSNYKNDNKQFSQISNKKKTILFVQGYKVEFHNFYFGYDRQNISNSNWKETREILLKLREYENNYNIIFKDAPIHNQDFKYIIKKYISKKIIYIQNEYKLESLFNVSDISIFSSPSTSFIQSLNFKNDIMVFDSSLRSDFKSKNLYKYGVYFYKNLDLLKNKIDLICKNNYLINHEKLKIREKYNFNDKKFKYFKQNFLNNEL